MYSYVDEPNILVSRKEGIKKKIEETNLEKT